MGRTRAVRTLREPRDAVRLALARFSVRVIELTTVEMLLGDGLTEIDPAALVEAIGEGPASLVAGAHRLEAVAVSAIVQWRIHFGEESLLDGAQVLEQRLPEFFYDPEVPSQVQRAVLFGLRSSVAALALARSRRLTPWLAQRLAETYRTGLYEYLRLLAGLPFVSVPEDVVSSAGRLNLGALDTSHGAAERDIAEVFARADQSGGYLTLVAIDDDP